MTSTTRDGERIKLLNCKTIDSYSGIYAFGDPLSSFRVRGVSLENVTFQGGDYGIAAQDNGDFFDFKNVRVVGENARAYFIYGVQDHTGPIEVQGGPTNLFGAFLVKAYDRDTFNIFTKALCGSNSNGGVAKVYLQFAASPRYSAHPR